MNNKKRIIILILILFIIFFSGYVLIKNSGVIFNNTGDNIAINKGNISKNISSNNIHDSSNISDNLSNIKDDNFSKQDSNSNQYNYQHTKKSKTKSSEITADDILKIVERGVWWDDGHGGSTQNVKLGKPYKSEDGDWLVGAFDKKTGKFLGSVWVGFTGGGFTHGPDSYSDYKNIISGKPVHESDTYKYDIGNRSNHVVEEIPDSSDFHVLAKTNPDISINPIDNLVTLNRSNYCSLDVNQVNPYEEHNIEINSSS